MLENMLDYDCAKMEGSQWKCWLRMGVFTFLNLACSYQNRMADQAARKNGC